MTEIDFDDIKELEEFANVTIQKFDPAKPASLPTSHPVKNTPIKVDKKPKVTHRNEKSLATEYKASLNKKQLPPNTQKPKPKIPAKAPEQPSKRTHSRVSQRLSPIKGTSRNKGAGGRSGSRMSPRLTHREAPRLAEASNKENSKALKHRPFDTCRSRLNMTSTPLNKELLKKEFAFAKQTAKVAKSNKGEVKEGDAGRDSKEKPKRIQNVPKIVVSEPNVGNDSLSFSASIDTIQTPIHDEPAATFNDTSNDEIVRPRRKREDRKRVKGPSEAKASEKVLNA